VTVPATVLCKRGYATLDVTEPEPLPAGHILYSHARARISPHVSRSAGEHGHSVLRIFSENPMRFLNRQALDGLVDPVAGY